MSAVVRTFDQLLVLLACTPETEFPDDKVGPLTYGELRAIAADVQEREARLAASVDLNQGRVAVLKGVIGNARAALSAASSPEMGVVA